MEHVIGGDRELPARELVPEGAPTGGDQHVVGFDGAIADRERVRRGEARAALEQLDAGVVEQPAVDAVEPRDLLILVRDQGGPGEGGLAQAPAETGRVLDLVAHARGVDQELLGDAADVDAGAAEPRLLGQRDPSAGRGGHPCRAHAAAAAADDEEIEPFRHAVVPAQSEPAKTMRPGRGSRPRGGAAPRSPRRPSRGWRVGWRGWDGGCDRW